MKRTTERGTHDLNSIHEAVSALKDSSSWILLCHEQPDGDTLGCGSALFVAAKRLGKSARWIGPDPIPETYTFLPGSDQYEALDKLDVPKGALPVFIDTTNPERTLRLLLSHEQPSLNIDHHADNSRHGTINLVDPSAGATAELAWEILTRLDGELSLEEAMGLYSGLVTDTGRFAYSCTSIRTHLVAADLLERGILPELMDQLLYCNWTPQALKLRGRAFSRLDYDFERGIALTWLCRADFEETGADLSETEGISSDLLRIRKSRFSALLVENGSYVRVSLRSRGSRSVAELAHKHGGGGHPNAAGMRLPLPIQTALANLKKEFREFDA